MGGASPTSAVRGGRERKIEHLAKKSALHFGRQEKRRADAETLGEVEAKPGQEVRLGRLWADDAAEAELTAIGHGEDDVGVLDPVEFFKAGPRAVPETRPGLPLLQGFPEDIGEEADQDVRAHTILAVM